MQSCKFHYIVDLDAKNSNFYYSTCYNWPPCQYQVQTSIFLKENLYLKCNFDINKPIHKSNVYAIAYLTYFLSLST